MNDKTPNGHLDPPALLSIDAIYDALDADNPEHALELARNALATEEQDPVVRFLAGAALMELDRPAEAANEFRRAAELDEGDPETHAALALALFRSCLFDESRTAALRAQELDRELADAVFVTALLAERDGDLDASDSAFERATELDSERFPVPVRIGTEAFDQQLGAAMKRLPDTFRQHLDRVAVTVEDLPSDAILHEEVPALDPELLGLFVGTTIEHEGVAGVGELPPRILLFKRNLERYAADRDALLDEIAVTLYHELGHYLGLDEEELTEIDLA